MEWEAVLSVPRGRPRAGHWVEESPAASVAPIDSGLASLSLSLFSCLLHSSISFAIAMI